MKWRYVKFYLPKVVSPVYPGWRAKLFFLKCAFLRENPDGSFGWFL